MNNINISVFGYEKQELYPVYVSKEKFSDMLNLLLITKGKEQHYVLMKDFNKFMCNQTKHKEGKHFCEYYYHKRLETPFVINADFEAIKVIHFSTLPSSFISF